MSESGREADYGQSPTVELSPPPVYEVPAEPQSATPRIIEDDGDHVSLRANSLCRGPRLPSRSPAEQEYNIRG